MIAFWSRMALQGISRRRSRSWITIGAIGMAVAALTFLSAIMVGVNDAMIVNSISVHTGQLLVRSDKPLETTARWAEMSEFPRGMKAALPRLSAPVMLVVDSKASPVQLTGVVPERERIVSAVPARVVEGAYLAAPSAGAEILIGAKTASTLSVKPGDALNIRLPDGTTRPAKVVGVFRTGIDRFDEGMAYAHLGTVRDIATASTTGDVAVFFETGTPDEEAADIVKPLLREGERIAPWKALLPELDQLTQLNVVSMTIVILLVVIMVAAGISNTVLVSVMDRHREFGILKAMGVTPSELMTLILLETAMICAGAGLLGSIVGALITCAGARTGIDLGRFTSENPHFVMSGVVYPRLTWQMTAAPIIAVLVAGMIAALWPARLASKRKTADIMRMPT
ncbi:MAG TPA: FtsX-like permease family protein [Candidatus Brocadiia bacterium]|nr:FtsX-like permease family protein [Candidatus Brocadiia bacterium]